MTLFFHDGKVLVGAAPAKGGRPVETYRDFDGEEVEICELASDDVASGGHLLPLRELFREGPAGLYERAARACQILHWRRTCRFCSRCGRPLSRRAGPERAMRCEACGLDFFARINPVVIVAIAHRGRLLLAERSGYGGVFFSPLAGFVEPGETIEGAVRREVREEVGLELASLSYVRSQPWPFPSNLMLGFEAEAASDAIRPDGREVRRAGWFAPDALPTALPQAPSIARALIDHWLEKAGGAS